MKFVFEYFSKIYEKIQDSLKSDEMTGLHEDHCTLLIITRSVLLRIRNVSDKR